MAKQRTKVSVAVAETQTQTTEIKQATRDYREDIASLAYSLWQARGGPDGSPEEDWFRAEREIEARLHNGNTIEGKQMSRPFLV
jgi:hypothetical protein